MKQKNLDLRYGTEVQMDFWEKYETVPYEYDEKVQIAKIKKRRRQANLNKMQAMRSVRSTKNVTVGIKNGVRKWL